MAMYKNIFVNEEYEGEAGAQVLGVNGEILVFGESAFASLEQATESADVANSIIKVTTGKYDTFYVADANGNVSVADQVVVVEFNGGDDLTYDNGEYSRTVTMEPATFTAEERAQIIDALNDNNAASGTVYTTDAKGGNYSTIYVGSTNDFADLGDINGISETIDFGNLIKNDEAFVVVDKNTSVNDVIGSIEHEAGHLKGESHPVTDGTIKDFLSEETDIRYLNGTTVTEAVDTEHRVMVGSLAKDSTTDVVGTMEKSEVTISADVNTAALWVGARYEDDIVDGKTATLNVTGAGTVVTAGDSELVENDKKIKNEGFIVRSSGIVNVTDGAEINVKWDAQTIIQGAVNVDGEGSKLTYEGSNPLKIYKDNAILTIKNGGELDFTGYEFQVGTSDGKQGKLVIESGATASIDADTNHTGFINHQNGLISIDGATLTTNKLVNNGALEIAGATLNAGEVSGAGSFNIGASVDAEGNAIATTLNIGTLNQDVYANKDSADPILLSGSVDSTGNTIRVYGDATISGMKVNAGYTGNVISATGRFCVYGDATITGNTLMYLNAFQTTNSGVIEAGSIINAATYNAYDMGAANDGTVVDARFVIKGELNTASFIVNNSYYSPSENDELIVAEGGVISANYANGAGRYSFQTGKVTVYGYAYGHLEAGGGYSHMGSAGGDVILTVDGTYAAEGNNNGKFIVTGDQRNWIVEGSELNVINGATYSWGGEVQNDGMVNVANSSFSAGTVTNNGTFTVSGNSTIKDTAFTGTGTTRFETGSVTTFQGK
ncbi:MAG: hypothetical protein J6S98_00060, partial [Lentisphaeria bacterium]|nr:hypothetical protein [Lentisphaeria bacterium]